MRPTFRKFWLASLSFAAITLNAQEYRARVQGTVADSTQAAIPGATVILQSATTGVSTSRQSDERGHYLFDLVLPGGDVRRRGGRDLDLGRAATVDRDGVGP